MTAQHDELLILDGGLATALEAAGHSLNTALWSAKLLLSNPSAIYAVHQSYYLAGADVATTASYQASVPGLTENLNLTVSQSKDLIRTSVELAQQARRDVLMKFPERKLLVAGSVGPYGAYLSNGAEYTGAYTLPEDEMKDFHRDRIAALLEGGVDLLAVETMPNLDEIRAVLDLLRDEFPAAKAWVCCTLAEGDETRLPDGRSVLEMLELVGSREQVLAVGFNCVPEQIASAALRYVRGLEGTRKPLVVYPNSGEIYDATTKRWYGERPKGQAVRDLATEWYELGARYIGGCCRTNAEDIADMAAALRG
ncbi:hypothetical protein MBLNU457_1404t1 [Dothideomycetes sp. NU457]